MQYAEHGQDPYCYPGTSILRNVPEIQDASLLQRFETEITQWQQIALELEPVRGGFDLPHLCEIHRRLFQSVYSWAGELRTVDISKDSTSFAHYLYIRSYSEGFFQKLTEERKSWVHGTPPDAFSYRLAEYLGEINAVHPFREGNGRAQRIFIGQLAEAYGVRLSWEKITPQQMLEASIASMTGNVTLLAQLIEQCSIKLR